MEEKCVCSVQIWKEVFDHFDRQPKKIETNDRKYIKTAYGMGYQWIGGEQG